jgi:outer membrane protein assembly factor BamB
MELSITKSAAAQVVANGMVYATGLKGAYAFDARSGAKRWSFAVKDGAEGLIADDSTVYFGAADRRVYALDAATGAKRWSFATGGAVASVPTVAEGVVYVGSGDHNLYALDAGTGTKQWSFATGGNVSSAPAVADGIVYVGSADHRVYAIR